MKLKQLKANKRNPRKITKERKEGLRKSLEKFGDLSGIIMNVRTGNLVGGHQRSSIIPEDATIKKESISPTPSGTIAEGYVEWNGERFKYREVDWDEQTEVEAMLAANKHGGEWDNGLLKIVLADFPKMDFAVAGFPELKPIEIAPKEESDEQYVASTPQTTEQIETGAGAPAQAFDGVKEKTQADGKRYVIIIDCRDDAHKAALKDLIKGQVEGAGGRFF